MDFFDKLGKRSKTEQVNINIEFIFLNSLGTKFQFKLTILNFRTKLAQKKYF